MAGQHDDWRLEAALAKRAHHLAAVSVGQADIHQHEIGRIRFRGAGALGAGVDCRSLELVMQRELLHQCVAQICIVIHDEDLASIGHGYILGVGTEEQSALRQLTVQLLIRLEVGNRYRFTR
jgi:hypothetical protein